MRPSVGWGLWAGSVASGVDGELAQGCCGWLVWVGLCGRLIGLVGLSRLAPRRFRRRPDRG